MFLVFGAWLTTSCTATTTRKDGGVTEGEIVRGDAETVTVDQQGVLTPIPREDIEDIEHPGGVMAITGLSMFAVGTLYAVIGMAVVNQSDPENTESGLRFVYSLAVFGLPGGLVGVTGAVLGLVGYDVWSSSTEAVEMGWAPMVTTHDERTHVGVQWLIRW